MAAISVSVPRTTMADEPARTRSARPGSPMARTRLALGLAVLAWLVVFVGAGIGATSAGGIGGGDAGAVLSAGRTHRVAAGETLWSIAARANEGGDTRRVVAEIVALNHLSGTTIAAGQVLVLP